MLGSLITYIIGTILIMAVIIHACSISLDHIRILNTGSTMEKMELLGISIHQTLLRNAFEKRKKEHKYMCWITIGLGAILILTVFVIAIIRVSGHLWGLLL